LDLTGQFLALQAKRHRKPGQEATRFKTDTEMIIDDDSPDKGASQSKTQVEYTDASLCKESLTSVNGFTRGPNGRIKFHKDMKKGRCEEMSGDDVGMADTAVEGGEQVEEAEWGQGGASFQSKGS
jgi:ribosomal RNA-processing protein 12